MEAEQQGYFPLFISLTDKKILVFGAGNIALRRIRTLLSFGASVQVVAPFAEEEIRNLSEEKKIKWKQKQYKEGEIYGVDFVLSATGRKDVDLTIYKECKEKNIPANTASDKNYCDFYFPAIVKQGNIVVGITSSGENHPKVRNTANRIRTLLERHE